MVAGVLALGAAITLAIVGVAPNGGHTWYAIQNAIHSVADHVVQPMGGHTWY